MRSFVVLVGRIVLNLKEAWARGEMAIIAVSKTAVRGSNPCELASQKDKPQKGLLFLALVSRDSKAGLSATRGRRDRER